MKSKQRELLFNEIHDYFWKCIDIDGMADSEINTLLENITEKVYGVPYDFDDGWQGVYNHLTNSQLRKLLKSCKESGIYERAQKRWRK